MKKNYEKATENRGKGGRAVWIYIAVVLFLCPAASQAADVAQQPGKNVIDVSFRGVTLEDVLVFLMSETGYNALFNSETARNVKGITLVKRNATIDEIMTHALQGTNLEYSLKDGTIIVRPKGSAKRADPLSKITLRGRVISQETKSPLSGAVVQVKGTDISAITDASGNYSIRFELKPGLTLQYYYLGKKTQEIEYRNQKTIDVRLSEVIEKIDEVVVTGFTPIRRSSFTGTAISVSGEDARMVSSRNVLSALQVFDPSLRIVQNNLMGSDPNTLPEFNIRGRGGIGVKELDSEDISESALRNNPNTPIFIMDGFQVGVDVIYDLDPNRIKSMSILKDAAASAIYGSRAANGVIVIETYGPTPGKMKIVYKLNLSFSMPDLSDYNLMNAKEKLQAEVDAGFFLEDTNPNATSPRTPLSLQQEYAAKLSDVMRGVDTDWLAIPTRNALSQRHTIYLEAGEDRMSYGVNFMYDNQQGVMKGSKRERIGLELTLLHKTTKFNIRNDVTFNNTAGVNSPYGSFSDYTKLLPYAAPKDQNGDYVKVFSWDVASGTSYTNPLYVVDRTNNFDKTGYYVFGDRFNINWYPFAGLTVRGQFGISYQDSNAEVFIDPLDPRFTLINTPEIVPLTKGQLTISRTTSLYWNGKFYGNYNAHFNNHIINVSTGVDVNETKKEFTYARYLGFPNGRQHTPYDAEEIAAKPTFSDNHTRLLGAFLSANYSYDDIYLFDASFRLDGSSEFGKDNRIAPFWATGVGMNVHNYEFMKRFKKISLLKIRASYGQTGKVHFPAYAARQQYTVLEKWYDTGQGVLLTTLGNPDLGWEVTNKMDLGFDLGLFRNRLRVIGVWYNELTKDLISDVDIAPSSGFTTYKDNAGEVLNRGFELELGIVPVKARGWYTYLFLRFAHNDNKILRLSESLKAYNEKVDSYYADYGRSIASLSDPIYSKTFTKYQEGASLTSIYAMQSIGINPTDGKEYYLRPDGSITSVWRASDQVKVGDTEPVGQGSFGANVRWKNFSLFLSFAYQWGGDLYNQTLVNKVENANLRLYNVDKRIGTMRWRNPGDITQLRDIADYMNTTRPTSRFVQRNNELVFNSLRLSYDFNPKLVGKLGMKKARIEIGSNDVAVFSSIKRERGLYYPYARTIDMTISLNF